MLGTAKITGDNMAIIASNVIEKKLPYTGIIKFFLETNLDLCNPTNIINLLKIGKS